MNPVKRDPPIIDPDLLVAEIMFKRKPVLEEPFLDTVLKQILSIQFKLFKVKEMILQTYSIPFEPQEINFLKSWIRLNAKKKIWNENELLEDFNDNFAEKQVYKRSKFELMDKVRELKQQDQ